MVTSIDGLQTYYDNAGSQWGRRQSGGAWSAWKQLATTDNPVFAGVVLSVSSPINGVSLFVNNNTFTISGGSGGIQLNAQDNSKALVNFLNNGNMSIGGAISPFTDNSYTLGASGYRWSQLWAATATINTSDERAKNTVVDSNLGLSFVSALRPVSYKFNVGQNIVTQEPDGEEIIEIPAVLDENGEIITPATTETRPKFKQVVTPRAGVRTHYGLIAQEVKTVLGETDFGGYIYDEPTDAYGLRYEEFIAPLIKAVQELKAEVELLKGGLLNG